MEAADNHMLAFELECGVDLGVAGIADLVVDGVEASDSFPNC